MISAFHQNLKIIKTNTGKGVITLADVPANTVIFEFKGNIYNINHVVNNKIDEEYILQIGKDSFLGPSGDLDDYMNHSCNPNCGFKIIGKRVFLISINYIKANTEITYDYSATSTDTLSDWKMECKCGAYKCRKIISGYQYLDKETKARYEKLGIVPSYLIGK